MMMRTVDGHGSWKLQGFPNLPTANKQAPSLLLLRRLGAYSSAGSE